MGEEKDLSTIKKRGRPKSSEETTSSSGRPKANSTANASTGVGQNKKRPTGNSSKKAKVVAEATESANKANRAKSTSKSTINFDENVEPTKSNANVESEANATTLAGGVAVGGGVSANTDDAFGNLSNGSSLSDNANIEINDNAKLDTDAVVGQEDNESVNLNDAPADEANLNSEENLQNSQSGQNEQVEDGVNEGENNAVQETSGLDLMVDDSELEQLKAKKKKKKKRGAGSDLNGAIDPDAIGDDAGLQGKKQKKKKWWLLLLLLLLLLIGGLVFIFRGVLFPPKPIVIVPQGMVIDIKETGINQFGVKEFIFKPGDTIEFNNALSVGSERTVEKEDGTKEELSPFSLRLRFYIEYQGEQFQPFIEEIHNSKGAVLKQFNEWYYWYDIAIPGAAYKKIIDSLKLSATIIGNKWQGKEVKLVLEYQTVVPVLKTIEEEFAYEYDPEWASLITDIYADYKK